MNAFEPRSSVRARLKSLSFYTPRSYGFSAKTFSPEAIVFPQKYVSMFILRLCRLDTVASGLSTRRFSRFSAIICAALITSHQGEALDILILLRYSVCCGKLRLSSCFGCPVMCFGFGTKFPGTVRYVTARALRNSVSGSRTVAANFLRIALGVGNFVFLLLSALAVLIVPLSRKVC